MTHQRGYSRSRGDLGQLMTSQCCDRVLPTLYLVHSSMKLVYWNIRGLNFKDNLRYLKDQIEKDKPNIIVLQETKLTRDKLNKIAHKIWPSTGCMEMDARVVQLGWESFGIPKSFPSSLGSPPTIPSQLSFNALDLWKKYWVPKVYSPTLPGENMGFLRNLRYLKDLLDCAN